MWSKSIINTSWQRMPEKWCKKTAIHTHTHTHTHIHTHTLISSVQPLNRVQLFETPWITALNCDSSPTPGVHPNPCPLNWWCHPTISSSVVPFSSCPQSFPASGSFQMSQFSLHQLAKVLEFQHQHQSFQWTPRTDLLQDGLVGSPCSPRDSQESSPTPQPKSINSSALSFLYSPTLTSIHDSWENHSLED